jgi:hypothetical protein
LAIASGSITTILALSAKRIASFRRSEGAALAQVETLAVPGDVPRRQGFAAAMIEDNGPSAVWSRIRRQLRDRLDDAAGDQPVMEKLVALIDIDGRLAIPEFGPAHGAPQPPRQRTVHPCAEFG